MEVNSTIKINEAKILEKYNLSRIFPEIRSEIVLINNDVRLTLKKDDLRVNIVGDILLQNEKDTYSVNFEKMEKKYLKVF